MESILALDKAIIFWVQTNLVPGGPDSLMIALSAIGAKGAIWILIALVLLFTKKYRRTGAAMLIGLVLALIVGDMLLKHLVMRTRPCIDYPMMPMLTDRPLANNYSFPSGHTFGAFAAATAMCWSMKKIWGIAAIILACAIGFSRIYLFWHYPSDVFTGAVLGIICGTIGWYFTKKYLKPKK